MVQKVFYAKVSYPLLIFIFLIIYLPFFIGNKDFRDCNVILTLVFNSICFSCILYLFLRTRYTIRRGMLHIKCGFINYKSVSVDAIVSITKTRNIIASPSPSFDRIKLEYGENTSVIISPKDKQTFVTYLKGINPKIQTTIA